jgi:hypothetical protein
MEFNEAAEDFDNVCKLSLDNLGKCMLRGAISWGRITASGHWICNLAFLAMTFYGG